MASSPVGCFRIPSPISPRPESMGAPPFARSDHSQGDDRFEDSAKSKSTTVSADTLALRGVASDANQTSAVRTPTQDKEGHSSDVEKKCLDNQRGPQEGPVIHLALPPQGASDIKVTAPNRQVFMFGRNDNAKHILAAVDDGTGGMLRIDDSTSKEDMATGYEFQIRQRGDSLQINCPWGQRVNMSLAETDTIADVIAKVRAHTRSAQPQSRQDPLPASDFSRWVSPVRDSSLPKRPIRLIVRPLMGTWNEEIVLCPLDQVESLKSVVVSRLRQDGRLLTCDSFDLVYKGQKLDERKMLYECNLMNGSSLVLVPRSRARSVAYSLDASGMSSQGPTTMSIPQS